MTDLNDHDAAAIRSIGLGPDNAGPSDPVKTGDGGPVFPFKCLCVRRISRLVHHWCVLVSPRDQTVEFMDVDVRRIITGDHHENRRKYNCAGG